MRLMKSIILLAFIVLTKTLGAQLSTEESRKIDALFNDWNEPMHPGGVVGVLKGGETVYAKAFGLANIEHEVKNEISTLFNIASISKQFTAMGIIKLHLDGKLSIDDEIHVYLDYLPEFEHPITIRHLMHHTSGLRSLHALLEMAGWRGDDRRTGDDLSRFMAKQQELNFRPGDEYLYCNTGYMMMAEIIEQVTGDDFIEWTKEELFKPLGMSNTYFESDYSQIVPGNCDSYYAGKNGFTKAIEYWAYIGSGNAHTTLADLLKWYGNFTQPASGWEKAFELLKTRDTLNNGKLNNYAFGVMMDDVEGRNRIQHGGAIGGYRSFACAYPESDISIVLLTNFSSSNVRSRIEKITKLLIPNPAIITEPRSAFKPISLREKELKKYQGDYWNERKGFSRSLVVENDTLWYVRSSSNRSALIPIGNDRFDMLGTSQELILSFDLKGEKRSMIVGITSNDPGYFEEFIPRDEKTEINPEYLGEFYSPELETSYFVRMKDNKLEVYHSRYGSNPATMKKEGVMNTGWPIMNVQYDVNDSGEVLGFRASNGRARDVWFQKRD